MDESMLEQPPIKVIWTDRLQLKTVVMDDLNDIMLFITRMDVMKWTSVGPVANKDQGRQWLKARALGSDTFNFAVRERDPDSPTGVRSRVIGLLGSYHWPECGYMLHPDFAGKGYATEGMKAFTAAYFERVPSASQGGLGYDYLQGDVDCENVASQKVLEKCGFTRCETLYQDFDSGIMGLRDTIVYRLARPGKNLEDLGLDPTSRDSPPPEPPVQ